MPTSVGEKCNTIWGHHKHKNFIKNNTTLISFFNFAHVLNQIMSLWYPLMALKVYEQKRPKCFNVNKSE